MAMYLTMVRADEGLANLGVVYLEGDTLAWRYAAVKWYWLSEHWSEISLGISKEKVPLPIKFMF